MRSARLVAPLVCFSVRSCNRTFRSPVLIRSFCLRVFAFPFGSVRHSLSRVIHPGLIQFLGRGYKFRALVPAAFCVLSVVFPAFAVKCFFHGTGDGPVAPSIPTRGERATFQALLARRTSRGTTPSNARRCGRRATFQALLARRRTISYRRSFFAVGALHEAPAASFRFRRAMLGATGVHSRPHGACGGRAATHPSPSEREARRAGAPSLS